MRIRGIENRRRADQAHRLVAPENKVLAGREVRVGIESSLERFGSGKRRTGREQLVGLRRRREDEQDRQERSRRRYSSETNAGEEKKLSGSCYKVPIKPNVIQFSCTLAC